jgi:hypothetical protein
MPDLEHNMDELFRRAADNYPLKTSESSWENIAPQLMSIPVIQDTTHKKNKTKKQKGLSLLMLLFLLLGGGFFIVYNGNKSEVTEKSRVNYSVKENNKVSEVFKKQTGSETFPAGKNYSRQKDPKKKNTNEAGKNNDRKTVLKEREDKRIKNTRLIFRDEQNKNTLHETPDNFKKYADYLKSSRVDPVNISNTIHPEIIAQTNKTDQQKGSEDKIQRPDKKDAHLPRKQQGVYFGIVLGPELNEVKSQGMRRAGFDAGIILGYSLNYRASVETGLLFAKKYYSSDGKYFKMDMPGMKVMNLEGSSSVFEIPLTFKYTLAQKNNAGIFSTAGISSFIMTNEKNDYRVLMNGAEQEMTASYKKGSRYFAAALDISAGYENKIGKFTNIRIEPYLQIPLRGIGVGTLPVMSTGLHFAITRNKP